MRNNASIATLLFVVIAALGLGLAFSYSSDLSSTASQLIFSISLFVAIVMASATKVASQWTRAVVLRLGKFRRLNGPGIFFIIPVIDNIPYWIDIRVISTSFKAEKTLTKDTVPVDVDAVLFWKVIDPKKASMRA